jgi:hypothetical protein
MVGKSIATAIEVDSDIESILAAMPEGKTKGANSDVVIKIKSGLKQVETEEDRQEDGDTRDYSRGDSD